MIRYLRVRKNPLESSVLEVTKADIQKLKEAHPSISMGNHDQEYLKDFKDDDIVGYVAGDLGHMYLPDADLWFINKDFFEKNYTILGDEK